MKIQYRLIAILFLLCAIGIDSFAQHNTSLELENKLDNALLQKAIEENVSALLTDLNTAYVEEKVPQLHGNYISKDARTSVLAMWETSRFYCVESWMMEKCLNSATGYQVRNIPVFMKEANDQLDLVIGLDASGVINDVHVALEVQQYMSVIDANISVTDLRRRQVILDFVENFRTAYNRKDIDFLRQVYSDDALIITGKVVKQQTGSDQVLKSLGEEKVIYQTQTKQEYLTKLSQVFANNEYVNILFDEIEISQHPKWDEIYGVAFKQDWNTSRYSDSGYVFLMIDFKDEANPIIHVRTWQPEKYNGKVMPKEERFDLGAFEIVN
ncbi:nuclear transport factor 2 family protein [Mangrovibacterium diazotrophicum]|uniref:Nuclear transport factor 2 family protein n=1 Tax=Mangrovibacterium diazotrophicum TaxID=1261403 RepID=A0A419W7R8_9BACT|nr:nuclear transport factor 2 family protein [Mangrovibacterium diazotrophicum]RKD91470.1 hypothetical protein BC643_1826 [Mangrovibacterium diazotrophicum]